MVDTTSLRSWLGMRIKDLRQSQGMTLSDLSTQSGIGLSTLSRIENGQASVTFDNLARLASCLGVDVSTLMEKNLGNNPTGRRVVTRGGEGDVYQTSQYTYEMLCNDLANKQFVPLLTRIERKTIDEFGPLSRHPGEEFVFVLEGEIILYTEFYEPLNLSRGDSVYFDSMMGHAIVAPFGPAQILWISTSSDGLEVPSGKKGAERTAQLAKA